MEPTAPTTRPALDLGRCLNDAIEVYRKNVLAFVVAVILFDVLMIGSLFVLGGPLVGGMVLLCLRAMRDPEHQVRLSDLFGTFDRFGAFVGFFFLTTVPILLGTALLIVPGVLLATVWLFAPYLMVDRNMGVIDALRTSWRIVMARGFWINAACAALIFALSIGPMLFPYVGTLAAWLVAPVAWLINTSAYVQEVKEHADLAEFAPRGFPVVPLAHAAPPPATA
jgi:hypothetical protein